MARQSPWLRIRDASASGVLALAVQSAAVVALGAALLPAAPARAADWPSFRGPRHNGLSDETGWLAGWADGRAPRVAWQASVGKGHSAVIVCRGLALTMGWDGREDTLYCFDAATGALKWRASYPCAGRKQFSGPRATPAADGQAVYTLSQHGHFRAYDLAAGRLKWERRLAEKANPDEDYGHAWSPVVVGDLVVLGCGLAVRRADGQTAWGDDQHRGTCAPAVPHDHQGRAAVVITSAERDSLDVVGVDASDGRELWRYRGWPEKYGAFGAAPIVHEGRVFITSGQEYHKGARLALAGAVRKEWESRALGANTGQCVLVGRHLYGVSASRDALTCVAWDTGEKVWEQRGFGMYGTLMGADGRLIVQSSRGDLVIAEATPAGYRELRRAASVVGETFTTPVLSGGRLYLRGYDGRVVCLAVGG